MRAQSLQSIVVELLGRSMRFAWLYNYLNTMKVFGYTTNDFGALRLILTYLAIIYSGTSL